MPFSSLFVDGIMANKLSAYMKYLLPYMLMCDMIPPEPIAQTYYRGESMIVSYDRLWKLLIDKKMNKSDLRDATGLSTSVIAKLGKGHSVTTDVLLKICKALDCDFADIMSVDRSGKEDGK
jgi:DNA-binding Xre family transcriptional regulator